jgi:hypothetical protein
MIRIALAAVGMLLMAGCATMFNPGPTMFSATSEPIGATVTVVSLATNVSVTYRTPATFPLNLNSDYRLTFELVGYRSEELAIRRTVNAWFIGSVLLGVLPAVVDFVTGSMWEHTMKVAHVEFVRGAGLSEPKAYATIGITDQDGNTSWIRVPLSLKSL